MKRRIAAGLAGLALLGPVGARAEGGGAAPNGCSAALACSAASLAVGGATIGANGLAVTGTGAFSGLVSSTAAGFQGFNIIANNGLFIGGALDVGMFRDAANTLALRNGVNPQTFNIYNTYTDASNYSAGRLIASSNNVYLGTIAAGTGTAGNVIFQTGATDRWVIQSTGHLIANVDNTYDIGASGANRPRTIFLGTGGLTTAANVNAGGFINLVSGVYQWTGRAQIGSPADGVVQQTKTAGGGAVNVVADLTTLGCAAATRGSRAMVTDATVTASGNFGAAVVGGGANTVPVYCDATSWKIG